MLHNKYFELFKEIKKKKKKLIWNCYRQTAEDKRLVNYDSMELASP